MGNSQEEKFNYQNAREKLSALFENAEDDFREGKASKVDDRIIQAADVLFSSSTQSYREALLGCGLARLIDKSINICHPYASHGPDSFNGRTLDEQVVNPFLHDRMIPSSKGPYLATFRRSVKFIPETSQGLRDKKGYEAFLMYLEAFRTTEDEEAINNLLQYLLYRFVALRDASTIQLAKIARVSLEQYDFLIGGLLQTPSGGLIPVLLAVAMFHTFKDAFKLDWNIDWQGINVADRASGVGGDITIKRNEETILAVEVTERPIDRSRVVATFNTKIAPHGIEDYLFFSTDNAPSKEAREAAMQYFAQGHDVNFLQVKPWLVNILGTIGPQYRAKFTNEFLKLIDNPGVPASIKVSWNDLIKQLVS